MSNTLSDLSVKQLQKAIKIKPKLEKLQAQLDGILGGGGAGGANGEIPSPVQKKRTMSAAGRAAIAAAARERWAKVKGEKAEEPEKNGHRKMSAAGRAKIAAAARKRWAAAKAAGKTSL